jgi:hypothetical protein
MFAAFKNCSIKPVKWISISKVRIISEKYSDLIKGKPILYQD